MCDCIDQVNVQLAERNTALYVPLVASLNRGDIRSTDRVAVATEKIDSRKRVPKATVLALFCPFCGEKYRRSESEEPHA